MTVRVVYLHPRRKTLRKKSRQWVDHLQEHILEQEGGIIGRMIAGVTSLNKMVLQEWTNLFCSFGSWIGPAQ